MNKKWILPLLISITALSLVPLKMDFTSETRYHPSRSLKKEFQQLQGILYIHWYYSDTTAVTGEMEIYLNSLEGRNVKVLYHQLRADEAEKQGFSTYQLADQNHVSAVVLEYLGEFQDYPLILDPSLMEERLIAGTAYFLGKEKPLLALVTGDWQFPLENDSTALIERIQPYAETRLLKSLSELPEETDIILLAGHRDLTVLDLDILQKFRNDGGGLLILASPYESNPAERDQLILKERSPFLQWMEEQGLFLEGAMILEPQRGLSLSDGQPYPAWFYMNADSPFRPMVQLWGSPVSASKDWIIDYDFSSSSMSVLGGQLGSLAPLDLQQELKGAQGEHDSGLLLRDELGKIALFGSRWIFSDIIYQAGAGENLESLNGIILWLSDQTALLEYREKWKKRQTVYSPGALYFPLQMLLFPVLWALLAWWIPRRRRSDEIPE